jgi:hypothetical protein
MRFVLAFGFCGIALATLAVRLARQATDIWWVLVAVEVHFSVCFLSLAAVYGLREAGISVEDYLVRPGWSPIIRVILMPYVALGGAALFVARWFDREGLLNQVVPGLYIGRLPFPFERHGLREAGINAVVNLCWEFPHPSGTDRKPGIVTARVPILDGSPPTDRQFGEAIQWVARWRAEGRCVLVHCAQGHGRSATIVAAILLRLGLAQNVEQAVSMIRAARPRAHPSRKQQVALMRYTSRPRTQSADSIATAE